MAKQPREYRISILLNEKEQKMLDKFCEKYGVSNRSRLIRETLMRANDPGAMLRELQGAGR